MLIVEKMLLKGEVGGCALNKHGNYIVDLESHGKIMELCFLISLGTLYRAWVLLMSNMVNI